MSMPKTSWKAAALSGIRSPVVAALLAAACVVTGCSPVALQTEVASAQQPRRPVRLVFVHHSCGENWLADSNGGLGKALAENNYFVSDTNYGWGPNNIGDRTDITDWPEWFTGPRSREYMQALYRESGQHCQYTRIAADPGGENRIVMFKSCFPNSNLEGGPTDGPARGEGLSVANAKAIYNELLKHFATQTDRFFVVVTAPPVRDGTHARNARAFNTWLVNEWLADYRGGNAAVFDFYNVLTDPKNHHRFRDGRIEYTCREGKGTLYYSAGDDDHPSPAGNRKATEEFVPLLNACYDKWIQARPKTVPASQPPVGAAVPETSKTVLTPPAAKPMAEADARSLIDDFQREPRAWQAFVDEGKGTRLTFSLDEKIKHSGAASLQIQYDVAPESWATCSLVYDRPQDWSRSQGLCLWVHGEKPGQPLAIVAYGGKSSDALLHFEIGLTAGQGAVDGWQRIEIPWSQLKAPPWQGDGTEKYDPRSAMGVAIAFRSAADGRCAGKLWVDDIVLFSTPRNPPSHRSDDGKPR